MACVHIPSTLLVAVDDCTPSRPGAALSNLHLFGMCICLIALVLLDRKSTMAHKSIATVCTLTGVEILRHSPDPYISMVVAGWMIVSTLAQPCRNMMGSMYSFKNFSFPDFESIRSRARVYLQTVLPRNMINRVVYLLLLAL